MVDNRGDRGIRIRFPFIGSKPVNTITAPELLTSLLIFYKSDKSIQFNLLIFYFIFSAVITKCF